MRLLLRGLMFRLVRLLARPEERAERRELKRTHRLTDAELDRFERLGKLK